MTTPVDQSQIYARIENGQIVEYPVYSEIITARGDPFSLYTKVSPSSLPNYSQYQQLDQEPRVINDQVFMQYSVIDTPFESLLVQAWGVDTYEDIATATTAPTVSALPVALTKAIQDSATNIVQNILDNFAKTKGYSGIASAASYFNSTIATFASEGNAAIYCRDLTWSRLYNYLNQVTSGAVPFVSSFDDILKKLPVLSWAPAPTYSGPATIVPGTSNTYTIENYLAGEYYQVSAAYGIASISGNTVTLQAGTVGSDVLYINNVAINISVAYPAPTITGASSVAINSSNSYTITNYYSGDTYTVTSTAGTVSISGDIITFVAPATAGSATITCNGTTVSVSYS